MTKLFRMPNSLQHFWGRGLSYQSSYAKGLSESCTKVEDSDYSKIFHKWTSNFIPKNNKNIKSRMEDWVYIKRRLSILIKQFTLEQERLSGEIGRNANKYAGDETLRLRSEQLKNNERFLSKHFKVPLEDNGLNPILSKKAKESFAESYNFCVGIEEYAKDLGYGCIFATMTVPGKMHPNPTNNNYSWDGSTVKEAHNHLASNWKKFIGDLSRKKYNIKMSNGDVFGCRAVEPHMDSTPHWHVFLYSTPELLNGPIIELLKKHFGENSEALTTSYFPMDKDEKSYPPISYIVKKINGAKDSFCDDAQRLDAWKSAIEIRSFQRFGKTAPTTHWRLFRKLHTQWNNGELIRVFERNKKQIESNYLNRIFSSAYSAMKATFTSENSNSTNIRRNFTEFVYALKKLEEKGHNVLIKELYDNKYGEQKERVAGVDFGNAKYIFKESGAYFSQ